LYDTHPDQEIGTVLNTTESVTTTNYTSNAQNSATKLYAK